MSQTTHRNRGKVLATLLIALLCVTSATAKTIEKRPYPAVVYQQIEQSDPPRKIFVANIDLTNPDVQVRVSRAGKDPDGDGEWETTLLPPTKIAKHENFEVVINGDFFGAKNTKDAEGKNSGYVEGVWAKVLGPDMTDGELWGPAKDARPSLVVREGNKVSIEALKDPPKDALQVIAGSDIILRNGENIANKKGGFATTQHPRTAVGIADNGKRLVLVVVDGRRKDRTGMQLTELADLMKSLGCKDALNLDGGGSSEMAIRNPETGQLEVKNSPSDYRERAVASVLGISIKGAKRVGAEASASKKD